MKFYSEKLNKIYDTQDALVAAETEAKRLADEKEAKAKALSESRKARAKEIDDARNAMVAAEKKYHELVNGFVRDYGSYHYSLVSHDTTGNPEIDDLFDSFFRLF